MSVFAAEHVGRLSSAFLLQALMSILDPPFFLDTEQRPESKGREL